MTRYDIWGRDLEKSGAEDEVGTFSTFRVYFKSFVRDLLDGNSEGPVVGIGVAICDLDGNLIFELGKPMPENDRNRVGADCRALIEALTAALSLNLTRVEVYYDYFPLFQYIHGTWRPKHNKFRALFDRVLFLQSKFIFIDEVHVPREDIKYAVKLALEAINPKLNQLPESSSTLLEHCEICWDNKPSTEIFHRNNCSRRFCSSCMKQYVEEELRAGKLPGCPYYECSGSKLKVEDCQVFLPPKLIEMFRIRTEEASIPAAERLYCPFPTCSALMSIKDFQKNISEDLIDSNFVSRQNEARRCVKCKNIFCVHCRVPWHENLSCSSYKQDVITDEVKLKKLADVNYWRQCKNCNNMIERRYGCSHIVCRCGYKFCYTCGDSLVKRVCSCSISNN